MVDVNVNARVPQTQRVINYLKTHDGITQRDALGLGIYRLASRISEIKKAGYGIITTTREVTNVDGTTSRIAVYHLSIEEDDE